MRNYSEEFELYKILHYYITVLQADANYEKEDNEIEYIKLDKEETNQIIQLLNRLKEFYKETPYRYLHSEN